MNLRKSAVFFLENLCFGLSLSPWFRPLERAQNNRGFVNGGFQTVVRVWPGEPIPAPHFNLNCTSVLPQFYFFLTFFYLNLTSVQPAISNHGLETTVYKPLGITEIPAHEQKTHGTECGCNGMCPLQWP